MRTLAPILCESSQAKDDYSNIESLISGAGLLAKYRQSHCLIRVSGEEINCEEPEWVSLGTTMP